MDEEALEHLEKALGVSLPREYAQLLTQQRSPAIDDTTVSDDEEFIINRTKEYRNGFGGAPAWPDRFIYVGDEDDACPYALDCETGVIVWTDHGNLDSRPLARYESVAEFLAAFEASYAEDKLADSKKGKRWWQLWK